MQSYSAQYSVQPTFIGLGIPKKYAVVPLSESDTVRLTIPVTSDAESDGEVAVMQEGGT